jgi:DnaJ-class molecular chaperone
VSDLEPNIPYEACPLCLTKGTCTVQAMDGSTEEMDCPVCDGSGLVAHQCVESA